MDYRSLGRTGLKVSPLCLGCMMFGPRGNDDQQDCIRIIHRALDAGINFLDTANVYSSGVSRGDRRQGAGRQRRDEVVLATKVHGEMAAGARTIAGIAGDTSCSRWKHSLRRLQTDYIDLYQIHRPDPTTPIEETLRALDDLVHQGKVRYIGSSTFAAWELVESYWVSDRYNLARFECEQPPYSILYARHRARRAARLPEIWHGRDPLESAPSWLSFRAVPEGPGARFGLARGP